MEVGDGMILRMRVCKGEIKKYIKIIMIPNNMNGSMHNDMN